MTLDKPSVFAVALILFWLAAIVSNVGGPSDWITTPEGKIVDGDYVGVYTAGQLALKGEPAAAYDFDRHRQAQQALEGDTKGSFFPWPYPPVFLFAAAALALLPYAASMLTWTAVTFAAYAAAIAKISTSRRDMLLMLAAPAAWLNLYIGQNGALSAALVGFGLVLLPTNEILAGIAIGLLSFKPHLGLLVPFALLAGGYYRAIASAVTTVVALGLLSWFAFGIEPWLAFPEQLHRISDIIKVAQPIQKIQSVFGLARSLNLSADTALLLQAMTTVSLAAGLVWLWRRRDVAFDLKAAALATAMTLASPYQFVYDLVILTIAQAFLLRHISQTRDADRFDVYGLILANCAVFYFAKTSVPSGVAASILVAALVIRHIRRDFTAVTDASDDMTWHPNARAWKPLLGHEPASA